MEFIALLFLVLIFFWGGLLLFGMLSFYIYSTVEDLAVWLWGLISRLTKIRRATKNAPEPPKLLTSRLP